MQIVLWDTRAGGAYKDFAGGFGVGTFRGEGWREKIIEGNYRRDYRSPSLAFGYLAAGLKRANHTVQYALDETPAADVYIFNPALMTVQHEAEVMRQLNKTAPQTRLLVCGQVASTMPESFEGINCTVLKGEPEQLIFQWEDVLNATTQRVDIGTVANLDDLPFPDWSVFPYRNFQVKYEFWKFPTAYVQSSRGCTLSCSYCPYIILENKVRTRSPERVVAEMQRGIERYGFRSFKFRDPLFAARRKHAEEIAERIHRLPRKIQFSVESRIELLPRDLLEQLRDAGLTSVTVGIETPSRDTLKKYKRAPIKDDKQSQFVDMCRGLGIRVVAGFMIGFPEDTHETIRAVLRYAKRVNPYAANFNVCTPYPGTGFLNEIADKIDSRDWSRYDVYTPNLKYEHLTSEEVRTWHQKCFRSFYFRWNYLFGNWPFLLPRLHAAAEYLTGRPLHGRSAAAQVPSVLAPLQPAALPAAQPPAPGPMTLPVVSSPLPASDCCTTSRCASTPDESQHAA